MLVWSQVQPVQKAPSTWANATSSASSNQDNRGIAVRKIETEEWTRRRDEEGIAQDEMKRNERLLLDAPHVRKMKLDCPNFRAHDAVIVVELGAGGQCAASGHALGQLGDPIIVLVTS